MEDHSNYPYQVHQRGMERLKRFDELAVKVCIIACTLSFFIGFMAAQLFK